MIFKSEEKVYRIWFDGARFWYRDGKCHREDGPAVIYSNGDKAWYYDGLRHREDGPAVIETGIKEWYENGEWIRSEDA